MCYCNIFFIVKSLDIGEAANGVTPGTQYNFKLEYRGNSRNSEFQVYAFDDPGNPQVISDRLSIITGVNCCKSNLTKQWNIMKYKSKNKENGLILKRFTVSGLPAVTAQKVMFSKTDFVRKYEQNCRALNGKLHFCGKCPWMARYFYVSVTFCLIIFLEIDRCQEYTVISQKALF